MAADVSQCDRVLWKTTIIPDPPSEPDEGRRRVPSGSKPFNRLSTVLNSLGGHLRGNMPGRSVSTEPAAISRTRLEQILPPLVVPGSPQYLFASPMVSPSSSSLRAAEGLIPSPRRSNSPNAVRNTPPRLRSSGSTPRARHLSTDQSTVPPSPPAKPATSCKQAVPVPSGPFPPDEEPRRRANSDVPTSSTNPLGTPRIDKSLTSNEAPVPNPYVSPFAGRTRQSSGGSLRLKQRDVLSGPEQISAGGTISYQPRVSVDLPRENQHNAFVRFWRDLPNFLHRPNVAVAVEAALAQGTRGARHHLQGEVVCLHYGTIDDAG